MSVPLFLRGTHPGPSGHTLREVLAYDDEALEHEHNYIQWLFPLLEESQQVFDAPILTPAEVEILRADALALTHQREALDLMLRFYKTKDHWLVPMDHNHLRITRLLKSLRLLQSLALAESTYNLLMERVHAAGNPILPSNLAYWTDAVGLSYTK